MNTHLTKTWFYRFASTLILVGFAMLCQPFTHGIFAFGFPVLLAGVILFMVLDHVPDPQLKQEEEKVG
jgi:hypothetical protein